MTPHPRSPLSRALRRGALAASLLAGALLPTACTSGPTGSGTVYGFVTDGASGARLAGATVEFSGQKATTNDKGEFTLEKMPEGESVLRVTHETYAPSYANVEVGKEGPAGVVVTLKKEGTRQPFTHAEGGTLYQMTEAGPYAVTLRPNSLATSDGQLRVAVTPVDPTKELPVLPGRLVTEDALLIPLTFADFTIYDSAGKPVNLKAGQEAVVELPVPLELRGRPEYAEGKTIHCYSYSATTGDWEDFVVGTVVKSSIDGVTPVVRASLKHFSWYGAAPETEDCVDVYVQVVDSKGRPVEGYTVEAFPGTKGRTDSKGWAQVVGGLGTNSRIVATRTYIDTDGSISGMPGAKVIDIGQVETELVGLVKKSCRGATGQGLASQGLTDGTVRAAHAEGGPLGSQSNPVSVTVGPAGLVGYRAMAILSNGQGGGEGSVMLMVSEALPEEQTGEAVGGGKVTLEERTAAGATRTVDMPELAGVPGYYTASLAVVPGARYTLRIDADGNGSIDGTGSVVAPGPVTWTSPTDGQLLPAASFTARWTSAAGAGNGVGYWANITPEDGTPEDSGSFYSGTATEFVPYRFNWLDPTVSNQRLAPGTYTATVSSYSGPWPMLGLNFSGGAAFTLTPNITGAQMGGEFYGFGGDDTVTFTLQ
jgi:hypothetical protein